ncbi:MAG: A24 family peptidase [Myxococcota bacterium]
MPLKTALFSLLGLALIVSVVTDLRNRRIPDVVTMPAAIAALVLRAWFEGLGGLEGGLVSGLVGAGGALALFGAFAALGKGLGWGDVKLSVAVGAAFGYPLVLGALMFITLAGAAQAVISLIWQGAVSDTLKAWAARFRKDPRGEGMKRQIPYSVAIALGSFWAMWWDRSAF